MKTVIFKGFEGVNKVTLDLGFKHILGIGLKQAKDLTDELLGSKELMFKDVSDDKVVQLLALGQKANIAVEVE